MKKIDIYDTDFEDLETWANFEDTTIAETLADIIEAYKVHVLGKEA